MVLLHTTVHCALLKGDIDALIEKYLLGHSKYIQAYNMKKSVQTTFWGFEGEGKGLRNHFWHAPSRSLSGCISFQSIPGRGNGTIWWQQIVHDCEVSTTIRCKRTEDMADTGI